MGTDALPAQETEAALAAERVEIMRELLMDAVEKAARARVGSRSWADNAKAARAECDEAWERAEQFAEAADDAQKRVRELRDDLLAANKRIGELEARVAKKHKRVRELQDQLLAARKYIGVEARVVKKRRKK
jgi:U3 small nucleolar ribonucleoprotein component